MECDYSTVLNFLIINSLLEVKNTTLGEELFGNSYFIKIESSSEASVIISNLSLTSTSLISGGIFYLTIPE